jgi:hypothetical protein
MSTRTSHRRAAAGKKSRQEKYLPGEKYLPAKNPRAVRFPDKNRDQDSEIVSGFAACEKCFNYSLTENGLCWSCTSGGAA